MSSSPSAASSLVTLEKPSSPARPFSSASSVARLTPALRDELGLAEFERFAALGDLAAYGDQVQHMPSILGTSLFASIA